MKHKSSESLRFIEVIPEDLEETHEKSEKIEFYLKEGDEAQLYYLQPKLQNHRIVAQQSVFLFGKHEFDEDDFCIINIGNKKNILKELHKVSNITEDKLFPDFEGFAWVHREEAPLPELTASALKARGRSAFDGENYDDAISDFSRAIEKDSNDIEAYNLRGRAHTRKKNYEKALKDFDEAINLKADYEESYFNRGQLYKDQEEYEIAIDDFDQAISLDPKYAEAYYVRGYTKYNLKQYSEAEVDFHQATKIDPNYGEAFFYRGISKYNLNQYEESLEHFNEAIRLKYENAQVYCLRGTVKNRIGQYELAVVDFNESIKLDHTLIISHHERAIAWYHLRRFREARKDLEVALEFAIQQTHIELRDQITDLLNDIDSRTVGGTQNEE